MKDTDDLGEDLRRVLHGGDPRSPRREEELLARVHAGARRPRARRAAGVGMATAAAAAAVVAVAVPLGERADEVHSAATPASPDSSGAVPERAEETGSSLQPAPEWGTPVKPTDVRVRSVTASSAQEFWVLGDATCPRGGECTVVGHTDDAGRSPLRFSAAPGSPDGADATLRMAGDGQDGWAIAGGTLFATRDGTRSWAPVELPVTSVTDVVTSESSVWVTGHSGGEPDGRTVVAASPAEETDFRDARLPRPLGAPATISETALIESGEGRRFGFLRAGAGDAQFVAYEESQQLWQTYETDGCADAYSLSATSDALWAICSRDDGNLPMVSTDVGETWDVVDVDMDLGGRPRIAAIDADTAFVSTGIELYVLDGGRLNRADPPTEGAGSKSYDYLGFHDDSTGFLIDEDGLLSYSDSGGASWQPVELP